MTPFLRRMGLVPPGIAELAKAAQATTQTKGERRERVLVALRGVGTLGATWRKASAAPDAGLRVSAEIEQLGCSVFSRSARQAAPGSACRVRESSYVHRRGLTTGTWSSPSSASPSSPRMGGARALLVLLLFVGILNGSDSWAVPASAAPLDFPSFGCGAVAFHPRAVFPRSPAWQSAGQPARARRTLRPSLALESLHRADVSCGQKWHMALHARDDGCAERMQAASRVGHRARRSLASGTLSCTVDSTGSVRVTHPP